MSQVKKDIKCVEGLQYQAIEVALQAKALKECSFPGHSDLVLDQGDDEATRLAYAIGANRWENGEIDAEREEFLEGKFQLKVETEMFRLRDYKRFLENISSEAEAFKKRQQAAFHAERERWANAELKEPISKSKAA